MSVTRKSDQFPLRLPDGLRDNIKNAADKNRRSMNSEIVVQLEKIFNRNETEKADATAS